MTKNFPKPIGPYICVEPICMVFNNNEAIGIVVSLGKSVNVDRVKIGDHIRFDPNYGIGISYKGRNFVILIDEHILKGFGHFTVQKPYLDKSSSNE